MPSYHPHLWLALCVALITVRPVASPAQDSAAYPMRYGTSRWQLSYGSYDGTEKFAVNELQRAVQQYLPYVLPVRPARDTNRRGTNLLLVGRAAEQPLLSELSRKGLLKLPDRAQSYTVTVLASPWESDKRVVAIAGADSAGVLYGVEEFNKRLALEMPDDPSRLRSAFDELKPFTISEAPIIEHRGIWTWGYVIYDYRRFLDNMARLKMNRLTIWNDEPPVNSRDLISYAHDRGISVVFGFHWGWGLNLDLANPDHLRQVREQVLRKYDENYRDLGLDGIYFQTLTEHDRTKQAGRSTADLACDWVNDIARALLAKHPKVHVDFGLHATSILEHYTDLKALDPRVTIQWEDAGVLPYSYDPQVTRGTEHPTFADPASTIEYSKKLATLRSGSSFSMVAKGWTTLRWNTEFEHHGPFVLGERSRAFIDARSEQRQGRWESVNAGWLGNFQEGLRFLREVRAVNAAPMTVQGLIEDGLFEDRIKIAAALLGEMLWNPGRDKKEYLRLVFSPYFREIR